MISINNNLSAANAANSLQSHYSRLAISTERLSTGLRINSAADDAAGLAIRELQRSEIAALEQGQRNVNDAISMLQTFDGALGVIDEKLIRMKELAEQAATGTYDSTQRLMIDSEFQAMGSEIDRIAHATDFNGIKLLCTKLMTWYTEEPRFVITDAGTMTTPQFSAANNGTPVLRGANANNYVDATNPADTINVSLTATAGTETSNGVLNAVSTVGTRTEYELEDVNYKVSYVDTMGSAAGPVINYQNGVWTVTDAASHNYTLVGLIDDNTLSASAAGASIQFSLQDDTGAPVNLRNMDPKIAAITIDAQNDTWSITRNTVEVRDRTADYTASYNEDTQTVTVALAKGGTVSMRLDNALNAGDTVNFDISFVGETRMVPVEHHGVDPNQKVKIHFGPMNDSAEDYYYVRYANCTLEGLGLDGVDIKTQDNAQKALVEVRDAIVAKDKVRAEFGAMQNRFENTLSNITIQAENLQESESRISDTDIALEMMNFVRNQILSQSATAMLAQANLFPQMVMSLVG